MSENTREFLPKGIKKVAKHITRYIAQPVTEDVKRKIL